MLAPFRSANAATRAKRSKLGWQAYTLSAVGFMTSLTCSKLPGRNVPEKKPLPRLE